MEIKNSNDPINKLFIPEDNWSTESKEITYGVIQRDGNG